MRSYILCIIVIVIGYSPLRAQEVFLTDLQCEYQTNPLGIDVPHPRFSWRLEDSRRGACQKAYHIWVGTDSLAIISENASMWDSGEISSDRMNNVRYEGKPFQPRTKYYWKVQIKDKNSASVTSQVHVFETSMWKLSQWEGRWIDNGATIDSLSAPYFRKEMNLDKPIKSARVYITGLGYYEFFINGKRVGDELLAPAYSRFDKTIYYQTFDVTSYLNKGNNALGVVLGNAWFNMQSKAVWLFHQASWRRSPRFIMDLYVTYNDGSTKCICSDESWKTSSGPITFNSLYSGEYYDARLEQKGWNYPGFDDSLWKSAKQVRADRSSSRYLGELKSQFMQPVRIKREIKPIAIKKISDNRYLYDMGENITGLSRLRIQGERGMTVRMTHGEVLDDKGMLSIKHIQVHTRLDLPKEQIQTDYYTLKGEGIEEWMPRFTYHGFQYVEVETDKPVNLDINNITGVVFYTDFDEKGRFECSNPLLNTILANGLRSYTSNYHGIPTDCPHREKNGWTGDAHIACEVGTYYYNPLLAYEKYIKDLCNEQVACGELPSIAPSSGWGFHYNGNVSWDAALVMIPWYMYLYYGDSTLIENTYPSLKKFMDYLEYLSKDDLQYSGLNDWCPYKSKTPGSVTSSANYYQMALLMSRFASIMGDTADEAYYTAMASRVKEQFNKTFFIRDSCSYANGTQTALGTAIYQSLTIDGWKQKITDRLVMKIHEDNNHLDFGLFGSKYVLNALSDNGHNETAYLIASQKTFPSWGYWAEQGYTTFHESWNSGVSRNHIMFGEICAWMQKALAGIKPDTTQPGYKHFHIRPGIDTPLTFVKSTVPTVYGNILCHWQKKRNGILVNIVVPPNTSATLCIPEKGRLYEGKKQWKGNMGGTINDTTVELESGHYEFELKLE